MLVGKTPLGLKTCGQEGLELVLEGETKRIIKKVLRPKKWEGIQEEKMKAQE